MNPVDLDYLDYAALERLWPMRPYGTPGWWRYVGRTRRQRNGLTRLQPDRGPRGGRWGEAAGADEVAGEIEGGEVGRG